MQKYAGNPNTTATTGCPGSKLKYINVKNVIPCCIFSKNKHNFSILFGLGVLHML